MASNPPSEKTPADGVRLQVQLIGRFAMADAAGRPIALTSRRARGLIGYLCLQHRPTESREKLCGLFWGDRGEAQARASLRQCLSDVRTVLPEDSRDCVVAEREIVRLDPHAVCADTTLLQTAIHRKDPEPLIQFLQRAPRARMLEDVELPGLFAEWLDATRAQFDRDLAHGVHSLLGALEQSRDWSVLRALGSAYLMRDPVDEVVAATVIRAETALGDALSARRRFESLRVALDRTFATKPGAEAIAALSFQLDAPEPAPARTEPRPPPSPGVFASPPASSPAGASPLAGPPLVVVADIDGAQLEDEARSLGGIVKGEIVAGLSGFRDFRVSTVAATLAACDSDPRALAGGDYLLGGGMWRSPKGLRLTAQLIKAANRQVIWSERMEVSYAQLTEAVDLVITKIIGAVLPVIDADLQLQTPSRDSQYARYLAARGAAAAPSTFDQAQRAAADLEALIAEDAEFILPYLPLARLYNTDFAYTRALSSGPKERARAFALAKTALSRDRGYSYAYTVVGWCHLRQGQWAAAKSHFDQALALNAFHADRVLDVGFGYLMLGDLDRSSELLNQCLQLNPTPRDYYYIDLAILNILKQDHPSASKYLDLVAEPTLWCLLYKAMNANLSGGRDVALQDAFLQRVRAVWDPDVPFSLEAVVAWVSGDHPIAPPGLREQFLDGVRQTLF